MDQRQFGAPPEPSDLDDFFCDGPLVWGSDIGTTPEYSTVTRSKPASETPLPPPPPAHVLHALFPALVPGQALPPPPLTLSYGFDSFDRRCEQVAPAPNWAAAGAAPYASHQPVGPYTSAPPFQPARPKEQSPRGGRRALVVGLAAAVLVEAATIGVLAGFLARRPSPTPVSATTALSSSVGGLTATSSISPTSGQVVFSSTFRATDG